MKIEFDKYEKSLDDSYEAQVKGNMHHVSTLTPKNYWGEIIYFLYYMKKVVYVGSTYGNVKVRIKRHLKDKKFDSFSFLFIADELMKTRYSTEAYFIKKYKPKYNKCLPLNSLYDQSGARRENHEI